MSFLKKQIKENFYKAFCDSINDTVNSNNPDFDWIVELYKEIKQRLLKYKKKDSKSYNSINESFDVDLFEQMIKNKSFNENSMIKLIDITYYWIKQLQAPVRDKYTNESKMKVINSESNKRISTFIIEVNMCLDNIEEDIENLLKNLSN